MSLEILSPDEALRLTLLHRYEVMDTPAEQAFDDLTTLAATLCDTPMAFISLLDEGRQWFKSKIGIEDTETPREVSFCAHSLYKPGEMLLVPDAKADPRFVNSPLVTGSMGVRFYAGSPLVTPEGAVLGSLCVMDTVARTLTSAQQDGLRALSRQVIMQLELRRRTRDLQASEGKLRAIFGAEPACVKLLGPDLTLIDMNPAGLRIIEVDCLEDAVGKSLLPLIGAEDREALAAMVNAVIGGERRSMQFRITGHKGTPRWLDMSAVPFHDEETGRDVLLGVSHDITAAKLAEERVQRLNRLYAVSSEINNAIVRTSGTQELYERACRIAVELGGLLLAWVGIVEPDGSLLTPVARWGCDDGYLDSIKLILGPEGRGPASRAIRTGQLASCEDIGAPDAEFISKIPALERGFRTAAAFPLKSGGRSIGALVVYGDQPGCFQDEELQLLNSLAENISFASESHQREDRRVEAVEALRESERRYRDIVEISPDALLLIRNERVEYVNPAGLRMLRATEPSQVISRSPLDFYADLDREAVAGRMELHRQKQGILPVSERNIRALDGSLMAVETATASHISGGDLVVQVVWRDITERKRTQRRFSRLVEGNVQAVFFWKIDGTILDANDAFLRMTGYSREDFAEGRITWQKLTPPEFAEVDRRAMTQMLTTGTCDPFEKEYIRKDGSRLPIMVGGAAFEDTPDEGVAYALDLTERKKLEQQFLRAQRMESVGTLAGGIAHDLNNALGPIITSIDLLKLHFPDPQSQDLIGIIAASAQRGADMVRQVLSFARGVEGKRMELQIKHLVKEIEQIANDTFLKHIHVRTSVPYDLWTVLGDPTQIHQVLLNLCVNARDAMPTGGTLSITAENCMLDAQYAGMNADAQPGPYVAIQVEDTGTGMPAAILDKIFEPFFTTKDVGKGTGLGLSTSLAIIKSHGGFIRVHSEPGKGTRFKIYLPGTSPGAGDIPAEVEQQMPRGHGERILVIDDEDSVRRITQQTLKAFGYEVILASDGTEAVGIYAKRSNDIAAVLTDMTMPIMDGPATIQVLKRLNPEVRIIAASGLTNTGKAQASALGVTHFLPKPYTAEALLRTLSRILEK
jgi:PAS domain S-box-containing protein